MMFGSSKGPKRERKKEKVGKVIFLLANFSLLIFLCTA
jgi:hypothetical protein